MSTKASKRTWASALGEGFFERMFEQADVAIFVVDASGEIRGANRVAGALVSSLAAGAQQVGDLLPAAQRTQLADAVQHVLASHAPVELRGRLDGAEDAREYSIWLTPAPAVEGEGPQVAIWLRDASAGRAARRTERLDTLGTVSGAMAHHYNNLLCCIATNLEYAQNVNTMAAMRRALGRTMDAVSRATELTRQLLSFAQADHSSSDLSDVAEVVTFFVDENEERLAQAGIRVTLDWSPGPALAAPREHLSVVLENLTANAIDAMPGGGTLEFALRWTAEDAVIEVSDSGPGIAPEALEHVFEPFFTTRGELAPGGGQRKAGMGLAVAHGLVREMGGTIEVDAAPGGGARFTIRLPRGEDAGGAAGA